MLSQEHRHLAVVQHEGESVSGVGEIEGDISGAGLENPEQSHDHVEGSIGTDAYQVVGPDAEGAEVMGELVGASVEFPVGQFAVFIDHGHGIRCFSCLFLEQVYDGLVAGVVSIRVEFIQELPALHFREDLQLAQRLAGIVQNAGDQLLEMMTYPLYALVEEKIRIVYKGNLETVFLFFKGESQVEFADSVFLNERTDSNFFERIVAFWRSEGLPWYQTWVNGSHRGSASTRPPACRKDRPGDHRPR